MTPDVRAALDSAMAAVRAVRHPGELGSSRAVIDAVTLMDARCVGLVGNHGPALAAALRIVAAMDAEVVRLQALIDAGKGTWPGPDYITDDTWARWFGARSALLAAIAAGAKP